MRYQVTSTHRVRRYDSDLRFTYQTIPGFVPLRDRLQRDTHLLGGNHLNLSNVHLSSSLRADMPVLIRNRLRHRAIRSELQPRKPRRTGLHRRIPKGSHQALSINARVQQLHGKARESRLTSVRDRENRCGVRTDCRLVPNERQRQRRPGSIFVAGPLCTHRSPSASPQRRGSGS